MCLGELLYLQVIRIADQGADIVRITVQGRKEADACFEIKNSLVQNKYVSFCVTKKFALHVMQELCSYIQFICSYNIPLVADIHFAPPVAMRVAECFDKIRVNPGNFGTFSHHFSLFSNEVGLLI